MSDFVQVPRRRRSAHSQARGGVEASVASRSSAIPRAAPRDYPPASMSPAGPVFGVTPADRYGRVEVADLEVVGPPLRS